MHPLPQLKLHLFIIMTFKHFSSKNTHQIIELLRFQLETNINNIDKLIR